MANPSEESMDIGDDNEAIQIAWSRSDENRGRDRQRLQNRAGIVRPLNISGIFGFGHAVTPMRFNRLLRAYSVAMMPGNDKQNVESGGKIILPPSCLEVLTQLNTSYPMLFKTTNQGAGGRFSHCGVLEFVADEGLCYMPYWMMQNLLLGEGDEVFIESVSLPVATFSKFEPQSTDFLDISNPKAMLENALRHFACLTTGDTIAIRYNDKVYDLKVLETKPGPAVTIIECDMDVDFAPPVGYIEPKPVPRREEEPTSSNYAPVPEIRTNRTFGGTGQRLDGKEVVSENQEVLVQVQKRGVPDFDYEPGTLSFVRDLSFFVQTQEGPPGSFEAFTGQGKVLRAERGRVQAED